MKKIADNKMEKQVSKRCSLMIMLVTHAVILFGLFSGFAFRPANAAVIQFYEYQITSNGASQENPDIYDQTIVYQDNRNGDWDIYMYDLQSGVETRITTNTANQINPRIYRDKIVYQDDRNGNWNIYMYDLTTHTESPITNSASSHEYPAINGNRIVWQDSSSGYWDIYMYDLSTHTAIRVTTSGLNTHPSISSNGIAYIYDNGNDNQVYYFDLSSGVRVRLNEHTSYFSYQNVGCTAIYDSHVVWDVDNFIVPSNDPATWRFEWDVYAKDVITGATWNSTSTHQSRKCPHISELYSGIYYIVYQGQVNDLQNWNIYLYRPDSQTEYRVTNIAADQANPRVSGGRIVYMDYRNGNPDIYMTMVGYLPGAPPPPTPAAAIQQIQIIRSLVADPAQIPTSDIDGANNRVKENRREALLNKLDAAIASIQAAADSTDPAGRTADYQSATDQLNSILDKTDGCALRGTADAKGAGSTPDWIMTCPSQALIDPLIRISITMLEALLQQSF